MIYVRIHFVCTYLDMFILCIYTQMIITTYMHFLASRQESHHYSTLYSIIHLVVFIPKSFLTEISSPEIPLCFFSMTSSMFDSMVFQNFQLGTHIRHFYLFQFLFFFSSGDQVVATDGDGQIQIFLEGVRNSRGEVRW